MGLGDEQVHSLVVFFGNSTFKTLMPESVTYGGGYIRFIKAQTEELLSNSEALTVIETIESGRLAAMLKDHRKHIERVKEIVAKKETEWRCLKCQGEMVQRTVKRGANAGKEFLGCKPFPKCRGIVGAS